MLVFIQSLCAIKILKTNLIKLRVVTIAVFYYMKLQQKIDQFETSKNSFMRLKLLFMNVPPG